MKDEYDFSKMKRRPGKLKVDTSPKVMISLRVSPQVLAALKDDADALGIGYQTLINSILEKHFDPKQESLEERIVKRVMKKLEEAGLPIKPGRRKKKLA
jgi:predicted DNA binding CopG/RHH family protein